MGVVYQCLMDIVVMLLMLVLVVEGKVSIKVRKYFSFVWVVVLETVEAPKMLQQVEELPPHDCFLIS